ncbi:C40 family peptidase [Pukyongiella litopenaei]|uniref:NlpC/P60 family protein n=1 Tax=Pukyongiella litopenaei TaxID=2605946 RepID=A0A2S0MN40_9RHOB|nr:NlpC/P60 family protein [Pukyongiella litopenaei]AVO37247.1 NlpC/P60 family protein [Pukyongiella litopenaei]
MSDRRLTPANARVAAAHLADAAPGLIPVAGDRRQVLRPVVNLDRAPGGARDRQLLFGETVLAYEDRDGWSFVQADKDGYVGYVPSAALGPARDATHMVCAPATHAYAEASMKSPDRMSLSFGSRVTVTGTENRFADTGAGFIPSGHLRALESGPFDDPVAVAALFLGTPYLWGGNSRFGIDCSGLVQAALLACGRDCPGDSDLQAEAVGTALPRGTPPRRGDLLFWRGHVAWVADGATLLHANAHHMAVAHEAMDEAITRIEAQGDGPVTGHRRP